MIGGHHVGDGMEKKALTSFSKLGNRNAFTYIEALPERLGVLAYLLDLGLVHDGICLAPASSLGDTCQLTHCAVKMLLKGWTLRTPWLNTETLRGPWTLNKQRDQLMDPVRISLRSSQLQYSLKQFTSTELNWEMPDDFAIECPCRYIGCLPSKGVRSMLIEALNVWIQAPQKSIKVVEQLIRLLHDASLILDDIEDNSPLRRGKAATHLVFGHSQVINSANFMFVRAVQEARKLSNPTAVDIVLQELERLYLDRACESY